MVSLHQREKERTMLTEFQKQKLPRLFAVHDLNRDGVITRSDFEEYTRRIANTRGWGPESDQYQNLLARFLTFWNGLEESARAHGARQVTVTEWLDYWDVILSTPGMFGQIAAPIGRMVFTILDQDGDRSITAEEYASVFAQGGLDPAQAGPAFARLDLNGDGRISVDEIMKLLDQFFRSSDPADPGNALFGIVPEVHVTV
jgi:Ca2+-binding EF-hand superfamily protein